MAESGLEVKRLRAALADLVEEVEASTNVESDSSDVADALVGARSALGWEDHRPAVGKEKLLADLVEACAWVPGLLGDVPEDVPRTAEEYAAAVRTDRHMASVAIDMRNRQFLDAFIAARAYLEARERRGDHA